MKPEVTSFFHEDTSTRLPTWCTGARRRALRAIDASRPPSTQAVGFTMTAFADRVVAFVDVQGLVAELLATPDPRPRRPSLRRALYRAEARRPDRDRRAHHEVQKLFKELFNLEKTFHTDGGQFDQLFKDGEHFTIGGDGRPRHAIRPGHTPACATYVIGDAAFVGDTLFMPDAAPRAPTFRAATPPRSTARSRRSWRCRPRPGCSSATTMARAGGRSPGRPRSPRSAAEHPRPRRHAPG